MDTTRKVLRVVTYTRISKDRNGDEHGVANQQKALDRYAADRGWRIIARHSDNDISASNGKHRPGFEAVMAMVDTGAADVVLCWAVDRFVRRIADLESVISRFTTAGCKLAAVSGDLDLSSDAGRTVARMLSVIAQGEVERKSARQKLAASEAARAGKRWTGSPRPFGWQADHVTIEQAEADAIRWAADQLLTGSATISGVTREWNARQLVTVQGRKPFSRQSVTTILRSPKLAGLRTYRGEIMSEEPGAWQAILTVPQWQAVRALLDDPDRKPSQGTRRLLGGVALCPCGNTVIGSVSHQGNLIYRCNPPTRNGRPGPHVTVRSDPVDKFVSEVMIERLSRPDLADLITPSPAVDTVALSREAASLRAKMEADAVGEMKGELTRAQLSARTRYATRRLAEIAAELAAAAGSSVLAPFTAGQSARKVWDELDNGRRRAVVSELCTVTLHLAGRGARVFNPDTVEITPNNAR